MGAQTAEGLTACTTNGPVTPPATGQHRPRKRGRRQAGLRRTWERGVAREIAVAPRRRALALSLGVAGGGDEAQTSGATVVRLQKVYQARSYGFVPRLLFTSWSRSSLQSYFWANVNKTDVAPARPPRPGTWTAAGGGTAPRSFDSPKSCARPDSSSRIIHERKWCANNRWRVAGFTASMVSTPPPHPPRRLAREWTSARLAPNLFSVPLKCHFGAQKRQCEPRPSPVTCRLPALDRG